MHQLHIPKTGGLALATALDGHIHRFGHGSRLRDLPDPVIATVRDPVARYVSAWDMCARQSHLPQYERWPTASDAALDDEGFAWLTEQFLHAFRPLVWWLESAEYARERCWHICHTETLEADVAAVCARLGLERHLPDLGHTHSNSARSHGTAKSVLTAEAIAALRERYAGDHELLRGI